MFVSGFVSVVGRPNVGKSTLINSLLGRKLLIVSDKPQTTRNSIRAVLTTESAQVIFVDTPGLHKPRHSLGDYMVKAALDTLEEVDLVLFMVEALSPPGPGDRHIAGLLRELRTPSCLVVNKIDRAPGEFKENWLPLYRELAPFEHCFAVSALRGDNLQPLLKAVIDALPPGPLFYPPETAVDRPAVFQAGEIIREKILKMTRDEIPHSVAVEVTGIGLREGRDIFDVSAVIYVERESQKKIVIGRGGRTLKEIGTEARLELEDFLGKPVYLDLWVKVKKDWRRRENILRQLGYYH